MANPLSDRGWSDRDYAAAVGTLMGEAAAKGNMRDFQAIADVIANRAAAGVYGKSIAGITMNPNEFSTWKDSKKTAEALKSAKAGFAAALNPTRAASLSPALRDRVEMAKQALTDVNVTGVARGLTQGATAYHNAPVTAKNKTGGWHEMLQDKYGAIQIGAHTFTGPGLRPDQPFDPITYNGQLAAPQAAQPYFGDVVIDEAPISPVPRGQITASSIPDITPAHEAGFSWDLSGATLPSDLSLSYDFGGFDPLADISPVDAAPVDFSGVRQGMTEAQALANLGLESQRLSDNVSIQHNSSFYGNNIDAAIANQEKVARAMDRSATKLGTHLDMAGLVDLDPSLEGTISPEHFSGLGDAAFGVPEAASVLTDEDIRSISAGLYGSAAPQMSLNTFNDVFDASFPMDSFTPVAAATPDFSDMATPAPPSGFSAGVGEGPWGATPDFSAPSLASRNAMDSFENAMAVRNNTSPDMMNESIAQDIMGELAPQTPQAPIAPSPVAQATPSFASPSAPIGDFDEFGPSFPSATPQAAPQAVTRTAPAAPTPSVSLPSAPSVPSTTRTQQQVAKDFDLPSFDLGLPDISLPSPTVRGIGSTLGLMDPTAKTGFMDAMSNIDYANAYQPGFLDTRLGKATTGAAMGFLTGGPFGAITNGLYSGLGIGDMFSNAFDRYANAYANLSPQDFAAFGLDGNWTDREPTRNTGREGGARVGDGSYSDFSGYNDNNPQGIL